MSVNGSKPFYKSKVFWFSILSGVVAIAGLFGFANFEPSAETAQLIAIVVAIVNIVLRFLTKQPVGLRT